MTTSASPAPLATAASSHRFLRLRDVLQRTGMSKSTLYRKVGAGEFPAFVKLGERTTVWVEHEVSAWMQACIAVHRAAVGGIRKTCPETGC